MGIPSFYRDLCRRFPSLIQRGGVAASKTAWLCLDFNCAMYHVLRSHRPFPVAVSEGGGATLWERELCDAIAAYMREIVRIVAPTDGVYVSCDGVVCAAKRRQQRLRRFKGPWIAAQEAAIQHRPCESGWDQNALTPGSAFMAQLGVCLNVAASQLSTQLGIPVEVSTTSEPGEGEHKLMARMRSLPKAPRHVTIYGLDADLILLSMLLETETGAHVCLLREAQEFERGSSSEEWRTLDIRGLMGAMFSSPSSSMSSAHCRDFVAAMSLLGNDFLPRSLTHSVRNDGIQELLGLLQKHLWSRGMWLVEATPEGRVSRPALLALMDVWATTEAQDMLVSVQTAVRESRREPRPGPGREPNPALDAWNALPATWAALALLSGSRNRDGSPMTLRPDWAAVYRRIWRPGAPNDYCAGVAWVWDYYSGRAVDQGWVLDHHLPPLWTDVAAYLRSTSTSTSTSILSPPIVYPTSLHEQIHLLAVLPSDSVKRLLLPAPAPFHEWMATSTPFWPTSWSLFDVGRTQMWECEAVLPLVSEVTLRRWDATLRSTDTDTVKVKPTKPTHKRADKT